MKGMSLLPVLAAFLVAGAQGASMDVRGSQGGGDLNRDVERFH